jgi:nitroreductase
LNASHAPETFLRVVGSRRSIRWFDPARAVDQAAIQTVLEVARLAGSAGNVQPWRAVVVEAATLPERERDRLLEVNTRQGPHVLAPVWIYWYADPAAASPQAFLHGVRELLPTGALPDAFGWSDDHARAAIEEGHPPPPGMPGLDRTVHPLPPDTTAILAAQEANAACALATLAAVAEGLGSCLLSVARPDAQDEVRAILNVPERFVPVWLQLLGHPAERRDAGGQRPRRPFEELFARMRWGEPYPRDPVVVDRLRTDGLLQEEAPLPGRAEELQELARRFADRLRAGE